MRIFTPPTIQGFPIIVAASVGLIVNFIGMRLLDEEKGGSDHSHIQNDNFLIKEKRKEENKNKMHHHLFEKEEQSLNVKAVYLETLSDTIGAAGVLAAGIIIITTKFYLADPIISIGLALFMLPRTLYIIKKSSYIDGRIATQYTS